MFTDKLWVSNKMKKFAFLILLLPIYLTSNAQEQEVVEKFEHKMVNQPDVKVEIFKADSGWGYDIYLNQQKYIHQDIIPSVPKHYGFKSEADAKKTADFVASKIRRNIIPPSVTPQELDSLGVYSLKEK